MQMFETLYVLKGYRREENLCRQEYLLLTPSVIG